MVVTSSLGVMSRLHRTIIIAVQCRSHYKRSYSRPKRQLPIFFTYACSHVTPTKCTLLLIYAQSLNSIWGILREANLRVKLNYNIILTRSCTAQIRRLRWRNTWPRWDNTIWRIRLDRGWCGRWRSAVPSAATVEVSASTYSNTHL